MRHVIGKFVVEKMETQNLRCQLDRDQLLGVAGELADSQKEQQELEIEAKDVAARMKSRKEELAARQQRLGEIVRTGYEYRKVDCRKVEDYELGRVMVTRTDTETVIESRPMNAEASQRKLLLFHEDGEEKKYRPVDEIPGDDEKAGGE